MAGPADYRPDDVVRLLGRHGVRYVLIGGLAAVTQGASLVTQDVDLCHARDADNLTRLADALREVHATLRGADPGLPFRLDAQTLAKGDAFTFATDLGAMDILATPAGTEGYEDLARTADAFSLFGQRVLVASVDDLIRMKRAAGRTKDLLAARSSGRCATNSTDGHDVRLTRHRTLVAGGHVIERGNLGVRLRR